MVPSLQDGSVGPTRNVHTSRQCAAGTPSEGSEWGTPCVSTIQVPSLREFFKINKDYPTLGILTMTVIKCSLGLGADHCQRPLPWRALDTHPPPLPWVRRLSSPLAVLQCPHPIFS